MAYQKPITTDPKQEAPTWQRIGDVAARLVERAAEAASK